MADVMEEWFRTEFRRTVDRVRSHPAFAGQIQLIEEAAQHPGHVSLRHADAVGDLLGPRECMFHRVLLVKQHADQQCEWVGLQQRVGGRVLN